MPFEVEIKVRLHAPEAVEARAAELGRFKKEAFKEDVYFRRKGEAQRVPKDRYRLRREAERAIVTFKQPISVDQTEVNRETEFAVDDAFAFFRFADRFGFEPFVVKRKKSRVYQVGRADVELNEVEHLGHFAELEILCESEQDVPVARIEVARVMTSLGLSADDVERNFYIAMLQAAYPVHYRFVDDPTLAWPFEEIPV